MLISHHPPSQYCRTYKIFELRFCARCSGIIVGILLSFVLNLNFSWELLILFPLPTFINFLIQELKWIKSLNYLKTLFTIPLGFYIYKMLECIINLDFILFLTMFLYVLIIEFVIAIILNQNKKLEPLIKEYENGIYID
jgi:uncharacterized membrane protein